MFGIGLNRNIYVAAATKTNQAKKMLIGRLVQNVNYSNLQIIASFSSFYMALTNL